MSIPAAPLVRRRINPIKTKGDGSSRSRLPTMAAYLSAHWFRGLILALLGIFVRSPALQGQRIWDDQYLSHDHPLIKSPLLILEAFRHHLFLDSFSAHYRPVQNISFIFDYFFWNTDEFGFHLTNVLFHVGSGILLYFLLQQIFASFFFRHLSLAARNRARTKMSWISNSAFLISVLWIVHPIHSAAVDYISGRADSLAFFFAAAGWLLFLKARNARRPFLRWNIYGLAAASGLLALLSREVAVVWIAIFVAHLFLIERRFPLRLRIGTLVCCCGLLAIYLGFRQLPEHRPTPFGHGGCAAPFRAVLMARALGDYARLMMIPTNLHMERTVFDPGNCRSNADWRKTIGSEYLSILGLFLFAVFLYGGIKKGRGQILRIFGASWFLVAYLPISNIVPLNATVAEHWLYLPSVGFLIFLSGCVFELPTQYRHVVAALAAIAIIGLSARSFVRSGDWADEEIFYKRTFAAGGTSARVAVNLGQIYASRGAYADAERIFREVLEQSPNYPLAQNNLADVLRRLGKAKEAEALFARINNDAAKTRKEYPRTWIGALNLATMRHNARDNQAALAILDKARRDYPQVWELISLECEILRQTNQLDAAVRLAENFAQDHWWHYGAALALGRLYAQNGDADRAEKALSHASRLDVHDAEALRAIVTIRMNQNRLDEAFQTQQRAMARHPDEPRQYILLSEILERMGRDDEARAALAQVSRLRGLVSKRTVVN